MEQIINYRDIPTNKRIDILNALERIGFFPAYGGVKTMQQIMEKSVPGSGPQFYFVFRENELIGYNFLYKWNASYNVNVDTYDIVENPILCKSALAAKHKDQCQNDSYDGSDDQ